MLSRGAGSMPHLACDLNPIQRDLLVGERTKGGPAALKIAIRLSHASNLLSGETPIAHKFLLQDRELDPETFDHGGVHPDRA
jgi:hypothetical protein